MADDSPETLEPRIARWLASGAGESELFRDLGILIESYRRRLAARFGDRAADEAVDDGLERIWAALKAGQFNPSRSIRPWISTVLKNRCRDLLAEHARHATLFGDIRGDDSEDRHPDFADPHTLAPVLDENMMATRVPAELERILDPAHRLLFAVAAGIADRLDRPLLDRWCDEHGGRAFRAAIDDIIGTPLHGRQKKLAAAFEIREATGRKRFERAAQRVADATKFDLLRDLALIGRKVQPDS